MAKPRRISSSYAEKTGGNPLPSLTPLTERQQEYINALHTSDQVIVTGVAGTGKTFISATFAARSLLRRDIRRVILTRPNVPAGRGLGFLPGTLEEKIAPWVIPYTDVLTDCLGRGVYDCAVRNRNIEIVPFEVMRGRTFDDAFILLDEAQNTTPEEMKMFLTRIGQRSRVVINGDIRQSDLKSESGLKRVLDLVRKKNLPVPIVEFGLNDIVRSDACAMWVRAFETN